MVKTIDISMPEHMNPNEAKKKKKKKKKIEWRMENGECTK
jgi:hypothetical protein